MSRFAGIAAVCAFALVCIPSRAHAAPATLAVPSLATAPTLDPQAPASLWSQAASLSLPWDIVHARAASEQTDVHVATDGRFLYVRFDARQREPITATQRGNDLITGGSSGNNGTLAWSNDDAVWVDLWPGGPGGFQYQFEANPNGSHNESSSENTAFSPHWDSRGSVGADGYTVTMAIPLNVLHGARSGTWRAQFIRYERATAAQDVWSYDPVQTNADDVARAGFLSVKIAAATNAAIAPPRVAVYALGAIAAPSAGGSTSRSGADLSVPVTPTADFFATFHPDYSNVELDQQTIAPSVYQRVYMEVRPFLTQAASYYNTFPCNACSSYRTILYTPGIPTPSQGYAFEGRGDNLGFAAFDAIGDERHDLAGVLDYKSPDTRWSASFQHVTADLPGVYDNANEAGVRWSDLGHFSAYANYSTDTGTNVLVPAQGTVMEGGGGWANAHFAVYGSLQKVGAYFNPVDGLVAHPDIAGYGLYSARIWTFDRAGPLAAVGVSGFVDRFQGTSYGQNQSDNQLLFDLLTKDGFDVQVYTGSDYWRFGTTLTPISQNAGFSLTYHGGVQTNNPSSFPSHGAAATPTQIQYATGHYGAGVLETWLRTSTIRVGERGDLTLTLDNTSQWLGSTLPANIQWFNGIAYAYQVDRESSFAVGLRHVTGYPPQPNGGGNCEGACSNVSVAYHLRMRNAEFYLAYGDPNSLSTVPQAILKAIFYVGGQKGT